MTIQRIGPSDNSHREDHVSKQRNNQTKGGQKMETNRGKILIVSLTVIFLALFSVSTASSKEYDALKGVNSVNAIFDMRDGVPQSAVIHLNLILDTYNDLKTMKKNPAFSVVFMASAVKLISTDHSGFSSEDQKFLREIPGIISKMTKAGIRVEVCVFAVNVFGVDLTTILQEIERVDNGWISEIGYQARGYTLVPVY
jgi:intracellular sulfur oxidation DsrE/DsrF family protein